MARGRRKRRLDSVVVALITKFFLLFLFPATVHSPSSTRNEENGQYFGENRVQDSLITKVSPREISFDIDVCVGIDEIENRTLQ